MALDIPRIKFFDHPEREKEITSYMTAHNWVAEFKPGVGLWAMMKEPYPYSPGPFEMLAMALTFEEAFDKAKIQQEENHVAL